MNSTIAREMLSMMGAVKILPAVDAIEATIKRRGIIIKERGAVPVDKTTDVVAIVLVLLI